MFHSLIPLKSAAQIFSRPLEHSKDRAFMKQAVSIQSNAVNFREPVYTER